MKNIQISLTAKNYADALVKLGQDNIVSYDDILNNLKIIQEICSESKDLTDVLENPAISDETKFSIIDEIFTKYVNKKIRDFLKVLIEKKRFKEFEGIAQWQTDEEIIGGLVVKINDDVIDSSLKNKLENLSKNII